MARPQDHLAESDTAMTPLRLHCTDTQLHGLVTALQKTRSTATKVTVDRDALDALICDHGAFARAVPHDVPIERPQEFPDTPHPADPMTAERDARGM